MHLCSSDLFNMTWMKYDPGCFCDIHPHALHVNRLVLFALSIALK